MTKLKNKKTTITLIIIIITANITAVTASINNKKINTTNQKQEIPTIKIEIQPYTTIYEGDIIKCTITGNPTILYWTINNQSRHTTFYKDNPIIFDPEPTPLDTDYVDLTVYVQNENGSNSDTVKVMIKRLYFGDIHWHSILCDGYFKMETMYQNAISDNYLDFGSSTSHAELTFLFIRGFDRFKWYRVKQLTNRYNTDGKFATMLAYEYTGSRFTFYNKTLDLFGDASHINFYYKDVYENASFYSSLKKKGYEKIFEAMSQKSDKGYENICFFHHPLAGNLPITVGVPLRNLKSDFYVNWTSYVKRMNDEKFRQNALKLFRGVEIYSKWGTSIGKYSDIPINWPYSENSCYDHPDVWVENALWQWSENNYTKSHPFVMICGSDTHMINRPGSANLSISKVSSHPNPAGLVAAFSVHNTMDEIWDAMNTCNIYGTQLLKIRANVRLDDQMALGQWIDVSDNLTINISAMSTFPGLDSSGRSMKPDSYSADELNYPIQDIWLIKKDTSRGSPWCKIIGHTTPNKNIAFVSFNDPDVQPNDFYYVAIRQKGEPLDYNNPDYPNDEYMAYIGPIFIRSVNSE